MFQMRPTMKCNYCQGKCIKKGYKLENVCVNMNGYYLKKHTINNITHYKPVFFYEDGSVVFLSNFLDTNSIKEELMDFEDGTWNYWGFYECKNDSIMMEVVYKDNFERKAKIIKLKGMVNGSKSSIFIIDNKENILNEYKFVSSSIKPDSSTNWVRNHRKYRIDDKKTR